MSVVLIGGQRGMVRSSAPCWSAFPCHALWAARVRARIVRWRAGRMRPGSPRQCADGGSRPRSRSTLIWRRTGVGEAGAGTPSRALTTSSVTQSNVLSARSRGIARGSNSLRRARRLPQSDSADRRHQLVAITLV